MRPYNYPKATLDLVVWVDENMRVRRLASSMRIRLP